MMSEIKLEDIILKSGTHQSPEEGMCIMEAVAYFNKEPHSDKPKCACPALTAFIIQINDSMNDEERSMLKPYILKLIGTRDGHSYKRAKILARSAIVEITPSVMRLIGLDELAKNLERFKDQAIDDFDWAAARDAAYAAYTAARSAAYDDDDAYTAYYAAYGAYAASYAAYAGYVASYASYAARSAYRAAYDDDDDDDADAYTATYAATAYSAAADAAYTASRVGAIASTRKDYWNMALKALDEALKVRG